MSSRKTKSAPHIPPLMSDQTKYQEVFFPPIWLPTNVIIGVDFFDGSGSTLVLVDKRRSFLDLALEERKMKSDNFVGLMRKEQLFLLFTCVVNPLNLAI